MPYKNKPRPYKKEYQQQVARGEHANRMERQRARRKMDKESPDKNKNGVADKREGKDISHRKALSKGGKNKDGVKVETRAKNRGRNYQKKKPVAKKKPKKK